jgi:hypothetical protein
LWCRRSIHNADKRTRTCRPRAGLAAAACGPGRRAGTWDRRAATPPSVRRRGALGFGSSPSRFRIARDGAHRQPLRPVPAANRLGHQVSAGRANTGPKIRLFAIPAASANKDHPLAPIVMVRPSVARNVVSWVRWGQFLEKKLSRQSSKLLQRSEARVLLSAISIAGKLPQISEKLGAPYPYDARLVIHGGSSGVCLRSSTESLLTEAPNAGAGAAAGKCPARCATWLQKERPKQAWYKW